MFRFPKKVIAEISEINEFFGIIELSEVALQKFSKFLKSLFSEVIENRRIFYSIRP